jgi:hypothetical protein
MRRMRFGRRRQDALGVSDDHLERVVELVRDAASQPRHGIEPLRP